MAQVPDASEQVTLINCIMGAEFPPTSADLCLETLGVTTTSPEAVLACAESEAGARLLHDLGIETHGLQPPLTGVPWLLFNEVRSKQSHVVFRKCSLDRNLTWTIGSVE